jgi:hypothetical protein
MKKTYLIPTLQVVEIQTQQMLAASTPGLGGEYGGGTPEAPGLGMEQLIEW